MKLNIGCGGRRIEGYTGVDAVARPAADIVAPAHAIPLADGSVDEILGVHIWEHFYRWECDAVITEWKRLLKPGANLVLELPNLFKCYQNVLEGKANRKHPDQLGMWGIYGDPRDRDPFMCHRWGWSPQTLIAFLAEHGFTDITEGETHWHPVGRELRDMRITARKG